MNDRSSRDEDVRKPAERAEEAEVRESQEQVVQPSPAAHVVEQAHASWGNATVADALYGAPLDGFGPIVAGGVGGAIAGLGGDAAPSNTAMLRALEQAPIDWGHPSLANLGGRAGGLPLPAQQLDRFQAAFGHDFSHVRVHVDDQAARAAEQLHAHAFALGAHVFFGPGEWKPGTPGTDQLLAHELTHVVQHDEGRLGGGDGVSSPSDPAEREAYGNEVRIVGELDAVDTSVDSAADTGGPADAGDGATATSGPGAAAGPLLRRRKASDGDPSQVMDIVAQSRGTPIPDSVAERMSAALGHDVSGAHVHVDAPAAEAAEALDALAFTLGSHVFFGQGNWAPGTVAGDALIAHELTHVAQHEEGRLATTDDFSVSTPGQGAEVEAEAAAAAVTAEGPVLAGPESAPEGATSVASEAAPAMRDPVPGAPTVPVPPGREDEAAPPTLRWRRGDRVQFQLGGRPQVCRVVQDVPEPRSPAQGAAPPTWVRLEPEGGDGRTEYEVQLDEIQAAPPPPSVAPAPRAPAPAPTGGGTGGGTAPAPQAPGAQQTPNAPAPTDEAPAPLTEEERRRQEEEARQAEEQRRQQELQAQRDRVQDWAEGEQEEREQRERIRNPQIHRSAEAASYAPDGTPLDSQGRPIVETVGTDGNQAADGEEGLTDEERRNHLQEQIDALEKELAIVEHDLSWNEERLNRIKDRIAGLQGRSEWLGKTKAKLTKRAEAIAEKAQAQKRQATAAEDTEGVKWADRNQGYADKAIQQNTSQYQEPLVAEGDVLRKKQTDINDELKRLRDELAALQGGGPNANREIDWVATSFKLQGVLVQRLERQDSTAREAMAPQLALETQIEDINKVIDTKSREVRQKRDRVDEKNRTIRGKERSLTQARQRIQRAIANPQPGQAVPDEATDSECQRLNRDMAELRTQITELQQQETVLLAEIQAKETEKAPLVAELHRLEQEHLARVRTEHPELVRLVQAIQFLPNPDWKELVADPFNIVVQPEYCPPGEAPRDPDATGVEALARDRGERAERERQAIRAEAARGTGDAHAPHAPGAEEHEEETDPAGDRNPAEAQAEKLRRIREIMEMPPERRRLEMERYGQSLTPHMNEAQMRGFYDERMTSLRERAGPDPLPARDADLERIAEERHIPMAQLRQLAAEQRRQEFMQRAATQMGVDSAHAQDAVDRLHAMARQRGVANPQDMLQHLAYAPPEAFQNDPTLAALASQVRAAETRRTDALPQAERDQLRAAQQERAQDRIGIERTLQENRQIATQLGVTVEDARGYAQGLRERMGISEEEARELLRQNQTGQPAPASPEAAREVAQRMEQIRSLPGPERMAALRALQAEHGPAVFAGASLQPDESTDGLTRGPVATEALNAQLQRVRDLPPDQRWEALCRLGELTGRDPAELTRSQRNRERRNTVLQGVSDIDANQTLTAAQRAEEMANLAARYGKTVEELRRAADEANRRTRRRLTQAGQAGRSTGDPHGPSATMDRYLGLYANNEQGQPRFSEQERQQRLRDLASDTGIPIADLQRMYAGDNARRQREQWASQFGRGPHDSAAVDELIVMARDRGVTPAQMVDNIRNMPPDMVRNDEQLARMQSRLGTWDAQHPSEYQQARKDAGLTRGQVVTPIMTPSQIEALERAGDPRARQARADHDHYLQMRAELISKLDESVVDDADVVAILTRMTPAERAMLSQDTTPDEDGQSIQDSLNNGCDGAEANAEANRLLTQGRNLQRVFDMDARAAPGAAPGESAADAARRVEQNFRVNRDAAAQLGVPAAEAAGHIDALSQTMGISRAQALAFMQGGGRLTDQNNQPIRTAVARQPAPSAADLHAQLEGIRSLPAEQRAQQMAEMQARYGLDTQAIMQGLYYVPSIPLGHSPPPPLSRAMQVQLARIHAMPPGPEKDGAFARLEDMSGRSHDGLRARHFQMIRENRIGEQMHAMRNLPQAEREQRMRRLLEDNPGYDAARCQAVYNESLARVETSVTPAQRARLDAATTENLSVDPADIQRVAQRLAAETGLTEQEVTRWIERRHDARFQATVARYAPTGPTMATLQQQAADREMSPEQFMDHLARLPASSITDPALQALRAQLDRNGYHPRMSVAEERASASVIDVSASREYQGKRARLLGELQGRQSDAEVLTQFRQMSEAERVQFLRDYRSERSARQRARDDGRDVEQLPELRDLFLDALQGGDETTGLRLLDAAVTSEATWDRNHAMQQLQILDPNDPSRVARFQALNGLFPNRPPPGDTDEARRRRGAAITAQLESMSTAERAEWIHQWRADRQRRATQEAQLGNDALSDDPLQFVTAGSPVYDMLNEAIRLETARTQAGVYTRAEAAMRVEHELTWSREVASQMHLRTHHEALAMMRQMSEGSGASMENTWRLLTNRTIRDEMADTRVTPQQQQRNQAEMQTRADSTAQQLQAQFDKNYFTRSDAEIIRLLRNCSPQELTMVEAQFRSRGQDLRTLLESHVDGSEMPQFRQELARGQQWLANQTAVPEQRLVDDLTRLDPTAQADLRTDEGIATRMAGIKDLPPERRFQALLDMQAALRAGSRSPQDVVRAFLAGPGGLEEHAGLSPILTPAMQARMASINALPRAERERELASLAEFMHTRPSLLRHAAQVGETRIRYATEVQRITTLPESERDAALEQLRQQSHMTQDELFALHRMALEQGVVQPAQEPLLPEVARRLEEIRLIDNPTQREAQLRALMASSGVEYQDLVRHAQGRRDAAVGERDRLAQTANQAQSLADAFAEGRDADIERTLRQYQADPQRMKELLERYPGGRTALENAIKNRYDAQWLSPSSWGNLFEIGEDPTEARYLGMVDVAAGMQPRPPLPNGVDNQWSLDLARIRRLRATDPGAALSQENALRARLGLSGADWSALETHAQWNQGVLDLQVAAARRLIESEATGSTDNATMQTIMDSIPDHVLAALDAAERAAGREDWFDDVTDDVDSDMASDFKHRLQTANELEKMDFDTAQVHRTEARVNHKYERLVAELDNVLWTSSGDVASILADCTPEELRALNKRMIDEGRGTLEDQVAKAQQGLDFGSLKFAAMLIPGVGQIYAIGMFAAEALTAPDADDVSTMSRIRAATEDPLSPSSVNPQNVSNAAQALANAFDPIWGLGMTDGKVLAVLNTLNPAELIALRDKWQTEKGVKLEDELANELDGDEKATMVALFATAQDTVQGVDRGEEMRRECFYLVQRERLAELKRDPANKGKSDEDLWKVIDSERAQLQRKANDKVKGIQDKAGSIFKAIDGLGDDTDAMLEAFATMSPDEAELVKIEYRRHYGKDMMTQMEEDLKGPSLWGGLLEGLTQVAPGVSLYKARRQEDDFALAKKLMDPSKRVEALREYIGRITYDPSAWTEDEDKLYSVLENMTPEERTQVVTGPGGAEFMSKVRGELDENEIAMVDALTAVDEETGLCNPNPAHVAAVKMKIAAEGSGAWWDVYGSWGTDESKFIDALDGLTPEQVKEAERYYDSHLAGGSGNFREMARGEFGEESRELQIVDAELRGDKVAADVNRIRWAAQEENPFAKFGAGLLLSYAVSFIIPPPLGFIIGPMVGAMFAQEALNFIGGADTDLLEKTLKAGKEGRGGRSPEHLARVRAQFNAQFGGANDRYAIDPQGGGDALDRMIGEEFGGVEKAYFTELASKGEVSDEMTLLYAMQGAGTKEDKVKPIIEKMGSMSDAEREAFKARFRTLAARWVGGSDLSLDEWVASDFSGRDAFEMSIQMMGPPKTPADYVERARMRYDFERGGLIGNIFMNAWEGMGGTSAVSNLNRSTANVISMVGPDGKLRPGHSMEDLQEQAVWQEMDYKTHGEVKDAVADAVSTAVQVVGGIVIAFVPGLQGATAAIIANLVLQAAATVAKIAIKGNAYGWEEGLQDLANLAVAAATAGMGKGLGKAGGQIGEGFAKALKLGKGATELLKSVGSEMLKGTVDSFLNAAISNEQAWDQGFDDYLLAVGGATVKGALTSGAKAVFSFGLEKTSWGSRLQAINGAAQKGDPLPGVSFAEHMKLQYLDNVLKSAFGKVIDPSQWEQWAAGKGLDGSLIKSLFVDTALDAAKSVIASRMPSVMAARRVEAAKDAAEALKEAEEKLAGIPKGHKDYAEAEAEVAQARDELDKRNKLADSASKEAQAADARVRGLAAKMVEEVADAMAERQAEDAGSAAPPTAVEQVTGLVDETRAAADDVAAGRPTLPNGTPDEPGPLQAALADAPPEVDVEAPATPSSRPQAEEAPPTRPAGNEQDANADLRAHVDHMAEHSDDMIDAIRTDLDAPAHPAGGAQVPPGAGQVDPGTPVPLPSSPEGDLVAALPPVQAAALTSGDKDEAAHALEKPEHREALRANIMDEDSAEGRARKVEALLDSFEGDADALKAQFGSDSDSALRAQIDEIVAARNRPAEVMTDDQMVEHLSEAQKSKKLTPNDVDFVLGGATEEERQARLSHREDENQRAGAAAMGDKLERYPKALVDAHLESDPATRGAKIAEVVEHFDKLGQGAASKALAALDGNPEAQLQLAHHLAVYDSIQAQDPRTLTPDELTSLVRAHAALMKSTDDVGTATLRKVIEGGAAEELLSEKWGSKATVGGCIGDAQNTEGLTGTQMVEVLGLDYKNNQGKTPYLQDQGDGTFKPVDHVLLLEMPLTSELKDKAKITVDQSVYDHISTMAAAGDDDAKRLLDRAIVKPISVDPVTGEKDTSDPYTGTGGTIASDRLPGAERTVKWDPLESTCRHASLSIL